MTIRLDRFFTLRCALLCLASVAAQAQQIADPDFKATVAHPAFTKSFPRVLIDEGHNNFDTATGRYKPFADLISNDGYHVVRGRKPFNKETLDTFKVLVIANALGAEEADDDGASNPAFSEQESDAVRDWVRDGGSLLLIVDEAPFAGASKNLGKRFSIDMSNAVTEDPANYEKPSDDKSWIVYSRENKLLLDHPIVAGRNETEKLNRVIAFKGQSLKGPDGTVAFMKLAETAIDKPTAPPGKETSAAGRAQGIALKFGKGRVVVLGTAGMLSAQVTGRDNTSLGMNYPGIDNKQLALNIMHWLSGLLK
jgi:hypothetical protein